MAHPQQFEFCSKIKQAFPDFFRDVRVLEIGSLDINGSVRKFFDANEYIGLDVGEGAGVDVVCEGQNYDAPDDSFDVVVSCECLEHNPYWRETFVNMFRLCRPGGMVLMTCAGPGRREHGTRRTTPQDAPLIQWDYYKNISEHEILRDVMPDLRSSVWMSAFNFSSHDTYFTAFKNGAPAPRRAKQALAKIAKSHRRDNNRLPAIKEALLISLFGETRYMRGSLLPWK